MISRGYNQKTTNTNTLVGKVSNGDFTVTRASTSTLTLSRDDLNKQDITLIEHVRDGDVIGIYGEGVDISLSGDTITITQRSSAFPVWDFLLNDTFIVYTNISRTASSSGSSTTTACYLTAGIDSTTTTNVTYIGRFEADTNNWLILKMATDGITYANNSNNSSYTGYDSARTDRETLTYDLTITF